VLNGSSELCVDVHLAVVAFGLHQVTCRTCGFRLGVLEETVLVLVLVVDVITTKLLRVDTITPK
tara:strand:- start:88 stop:279 length:192 start_codon:yes stop_codon:yes gene_type:complete